MKGRRDDREQSPWSALRRLGSGMASIWRRAGSDRDGRGHQATTSDRTRSWQAVLGVAGAREFVEPHLRGLVAEQLGVGAGELRSHVSLRDDLAADSLDLLELALVVEHEFAIAIPDRLLDGVLSYGDLVDATVGLVLEHARGQRKSAEQAPRFRAQLAPAERDSGGAFTFAGVLTPYVAETIAWDARMVGSGARLDIVVVPGTTDLDCARVGDRFAHLAGRGVHVTVRRDDRAMGFEPPVVTAPSANTA